MPGLLPGLLRSFAPSSRLVSTSLPRLRLPSSCPRSVCGRSGRVPRQSLDAPKNLPKQARRQGALGELQDEVPGMPNEAATGLEEPLLEARQRPALDSRGEGEPAQEIPEVVRDDAQEQPHLIGSEMVTGEAGPTVASLTAVVTQRRRSSVNSSKSSSFGRGQNLRRG